MELSNSTAHNYLVNLGNSEIIMTNLSETKVSLIIYDKNKFNTPDYYFSYALYANDEISHEVKIASYNYEVIGPNGFIRKFKGNKKPDLKVVLFNNVAKNEVELLLTKISTRKLDISLENLYEGKKRDISLNSSTEKIIFNLDKTKGWYDLRIKTENNSWHFAGRIESGKPTVTDPHWS